MTLGYLMLLQCTVCWMVFTNRSHCCVSEKNVCFAWCYRQLPGGPSWQAALRQFEWRRCIHHDGVVPVADCRWRCVRDGSISVLSDRCFSDWLLTRFCSAWQWDHCYTVLIQGLLIFLSCNKITTTVIFKNCTRNFALDHSKWWKSL